MKAAMDVVRGDRFWCAGDRAWRARWWTAVEDARPRGDLVVITVVDDEGFRDVVSATPDFPLGDAP